MKTTQTAAISLMALMAAAVTAAASAQSATPTPSPVSDQSPTSAPSPADQSDLCRSRSPLRATLVSCDPEFRRFANTISSTSRSRLGITPVTSSKPLWIRDPGLARALAGLTREAGPGIDETLRNLPGTVIEIRHPFALMAAGCRHGKSAAPAQSATSTRSATSAQSPPAESAACGVQVQSRMVWGRDMADFILRFEESEWARSVRSRSGVANGDDAPWVVRRRPRIPDPNLTSALSKLIREAGPSIEETLRNMPGTVIEIRHP